MTLRMNLRGASVRRERARAGKWHVNRDADQPDMDVHPVIPARLAPPVRPDS